MLQRLYARVLNFGLRFCLTTNDVFAIDSPAVPGPVYAAVRRTWPVAKLYALSATWRARL